MKKTKLIMTIIATVSLCLVVVAGTTIAWMASNSRVSGSIGIGVTSGYDVQITYNSSEVWQQGGDAKQLNFDQMACGKGVTLNIKVTNNESSTLGIILHLRPSDSTGEVPKIVDENKYYLGSQIRISDIKKGTDAFTSTSEGEYLVRIAGDVVSIPTLTLISDSVPQGDAEYSVTFTFVDNGENQNEYLNFSSSGGKCSRSLFLEITGEV